MHSVEPFSLEYLPAEQLLHDELPVLECLPASGVSVMCEYVSGSLMRVADQWWSVSGG